MKDTKKRRSTRFKVKALARWRWLAERGVGLAAAAAEIGVAEADLRAWSSGEPTVERLLVPVHIEEGSTTVVERGLVAVLAGGVRVEGLTLDDVVALARRLS